MKSVLTAVLTSATALVLLLVSPLLSARVSGPHLIAQEGDMSVTLFLEACETTKGVFSEMPADMRPDYKEARIVYEGKEYRACWTEVDKSTIYVIDETGDQGALPKSIFKKPDVI